MASLIGSYEGEIAERHRKANGKLTVYLYESSGGKFFQFSFDDGRYIVLAEDQVKDLINELTRVLKIGEGL